MVLSSNTKQAFDRFFAVVNQKIDTVQINAYFMPNVNIVERFLDVFQLCRPRFMKPNMYNEHPREAVS
jgi:hypothetical protein